jgi:NADH-quinone oxidoreductase subunit N
MTPADLLALGPLAAWGVAAVLALLACPFTSLGRVRALAAAGLLGGGAWAWGQLGAGAHEVGDLLVVDRPARLLWMYAAGGGALVLALLEDAPRETAVLLVVSALGAGVLGAATHGAAIVSSLALVSTPLIGAIAGRARDADALGAAYIYLILAGVASAATGLGVALALAAQGTLASSGPVGQGDEAAVAGATLLVLGLAFEVGAPPLHGWVPDVYRAAPPAVAGFSGTVARSGALLALARRLRAEALPPPVAELVVPVLAGAAVVLGALLGLRQRSLRRMLGCSSIAHGGFLIAMATADAPLEGLLFYLCAYGAAVLAAFAVAARLPPAAGRAELRGLLGRRPGLGGAWALALLSLAGLPVTGGFAAKLLMFGALAHDGQWALIAAAGLGTGLGLVMYARFGLPVLADPGPEAPRLRGAGPWARAALFLLALAILWLGVAPPA